jgi:UPF0716 protein FxsA
MLMACSPATAFIKRFNTRRHDPLTFIPLFILALPIIEIAVFILVGGKIGLLWTIALVILSGVAGSLLLRIQGFGALNRIRAELDAGRDPGRELAHGAMIMLAGVLLLIPGFVTDVIGLLLFIPPVRDAAWRFLKRRIVVSGSFPTGFGGFRNRGRDAKTIDLDAEDYSRTPDPKSPWRIGADD